MRYWFLVPSTRLRFSKPASRNPEGQNRPNFNHSHVDFLGSSLRAERRLMHSPTNLRTKSEAACCTVRVFNTGAMWISMLCAGLLTLSGWSSENIALLCVGFAWHGLVCFLAFAFAWGPTLKILLWCDGRLPILGAPEFALKMLWVTGARCFF